MAARVTSGRPLWRPDVLHPASRKSAPTPRRPSHVWMGVSVEVRDFFWRVDYLRRVPASVRFISSEPLLGSPADINLDEIHWLIASGESQPGCRPAEADWFRELRDACTPRR